MSLIKRLRDVFRPAPSRPQAQARVTSAPPPPDAEAEAGLRARLEEDPNDVEAFSTLAEIVRRRAAEVEHPDPLTADVAPVTSSREADTAHWALAEELAGRPRGWYPLIELARLSLEDDKEGAMRRLGAACERETSGLALIEGIKMLRAAHLPAEALGLGVGHWSPAEQSPEAGRQIVEAALEAARVTDARRHLRDLAELSTHHDTPRIVAELEPFVARAESDASTVD
ncbi:hypothetical protein IM660_10775 [Ruania alkalisoli]|uniref:Uncharacterized protein n=1 Tax=Ruania alkalisoli TaxID=2779775 RepID=A0A7M1SP04_9MICO|nr:hypothetical protein [Ruania alkalisoli]QOR69205.1 hypothetical protein IM660_10775 [Ruania alkalisoli]